MTSTVDSHVRHFLPDTDARAALWDELKHLVEQYIDGIESRRVACSTDQKPARQAAAEFSFVNPAPAIDVLERFTAALSEFQVHTPHPCYFGLFNPAPTFMSIVGDTLAAAFNPQLAAWSHSPLAVECEQRLIQEFASRFGFPMSETGGNFTSGGAEANQTAVLCALQSHWPAFAQQGARVARRQPVFYISKEGHHSFQKAARAAGLGDNAIRSIGVGPNLRMDVAAVERQLEADRFEGCEPFLLVATAGTTAAGIIDPLDPLADLAHEHGLWFHVDAAWGGAAALVPELKAELAGIEKADSITFDAHKFLSVPMGAGMFLTRRCSLLSELFGISNAYMPRESEGLGVVDPYSHSLQWSRRFIGLKLFLSLATAGWDGYIETIRHQTIMGELLRERLRESGWTVLNQTSLPLVCFTNARETWDRATHQRIAETVITSGCAWISTVLLNSNTPALRACITNYRTGPQHIETLISALNEARDHCTIACGAGA